MGYSRSGNGQSPIIIIDIDGTLVKYPKYFEEYVSGIMGTKLNIEEIKCFSDYEILKNRYRKSGIKRKLPLINPNIPSIVSELKKTYTIWIVTARSNYISGTDTIYWLLKNRIKYDEIFFVSDKIEFIKYIKNVEFIIDDSINVTDITVININNDGSKWEEVIKCCQK